jgi:hypothetical protein
MKDQWVGDIGDFGKYGLLRALCGGQEQQRLRLAVVWYLTESDLGFVPELGRNSGPFSYLHRCRLNDEKFRKCDPELYDELHRIVYEGPRTVAGIRDSLVLPAGTAFYDGRIDQLDRPEFLAAAKTAILDAEAAIDLVYLDPDNGIHEQGATETAFAVSCDDLRYFWQLGKSLVIYHHFSRNCSEPDQMENAVHVVTDALGLTDGIRPLILRWCSVISRSYIIVPTDQHRDILLDRARQHAGSEWRRHFSASPKRMRRRALDPNPAEDRTDESDKLTLDQVIETLDLHGRRATYGAVGEYLGGLTGWDVGRLMSRRPRSYRNSWVVNKRTGHPRVYLRNEIDPRLWTSPPAITTGADLAAWFIR